ncbi:hypothetical protein CK203_073954 [Vitis vinifera]|uniref:Uncharacterized protein n=1 Tax=Vitis vinifera TaxID=29760 RepID=A0A438DPZ3_VITVI|nr:hypothetical protein CK203_073954 [Vitis vinifera]
MAKSHTADQIIESDLDHSHQRWHHSHLTCSMCLESVGHVITLAIMTSFLDSKASLVYEVP